ncbi:hypothetical protein L915_06186, partial [Phytophthora nicotianae]
SSNEKRALWSLISFLQYRSIKLKLKALMQVSRVFDDDFRRFRASRMAVAPVASYQVLTKTKTRTEPVDEIHLDVIQCCTLCGVLVHQNTAKILCQSCRRQRQNSLEDIRPASPMAGTSNTPPHINNDGGVLSRSTVDGETEAIDDDFRTSSMFRANEDADSFRNMEVLTCFRSEVRRGLRLLSKAATAEKWHMCWAILLSMCLIPLILTLMMVASVSFLVLSTWVVIATAITYPLAYINPRLYNYAMNS